MLKKIIKINAILPFIFGFSYLICIPFYKGSINLQDIFIWTFICLTLFYLIKNFSKNELLSSIIPLFQENIITFLFLILINLSIFFSFLANLENKNILSQLGYYKSLFFLPILFALISKFFSQKYFKNQKNELKINPLNLFIGYFIYSGFIGFLGIFYLLADNLTFDQRLKIFFQSPNQLAMTLALGILIGIFLLQKNKRQFFHWLITAILTAEIIGLFFTRSQGALVAVFITLVGSLLFKHKLIHRKIFFFLILLISLLSIFCLFNFSLTKNFSIYNFTNQTNSSLSRLAIWQAGTKINQDYFPLGIGLGNFQEKYLSYQKYFSPYPQWAVPHSHNFWLNLSLEIGFLGFVCVFIISFSALYLFLKEKTPLNILRASLLIYFIIHSLIDVPFAKNDLSLLFWILVL